MRAVVDGATAKGVNFVSIFDSCHSGTALRDPMGAVVEGRVRGGAPPIMSPSRPVPARASPPAGRAAGYRVHFGAAADGEEALEIARPDLQGGVFTIAMAETLIALPNATFHDIAAEVRLKMIERGHALQTPQAEGALNASLGGAQRDAVLLAASSEGDAVTIAGGRLSGVTEGSAFSLFATAGDALADEAVPLATGRVERIDASRAMLKLDARPRAKLPARLVARETAHAFGMRRLLVRIDFEPGRARAHPRGAGGLAVRSGRSSRRR